VAGTIKRREFAALLAGAALTATRAAWAQAPQPMRRIAMILGLEEGDPEAKARIKAFRLGLRDLGWIEGRNIEVVYRFPGSNLAAIEKQVGEAIALAPELIVAVSSPIVLALRRAKPPIPIVFINVTDAVGQGFITNIAHPGGNLTGFSFIEPEIVGKWVDLLREIKPDVARVGVIFNPDTAPFFDRYFRSFKAQPRQPAVDLDVMHVRSVADIEQAVAKTGREPAAALIAPSDIFILQARDTVLRSAEKYRLPVISPYRQFVVEGCLVSYGPDTGDIARRAASYVDRILKGEQPGNLPVQSPVRYELAINLKTAKALGLTITDSFLELADEVIE